MGEGYGWFSAACTMHVGDLILLPFAFFYICVLSSNVLGYLVIVIRLLPDRGGFVTYIWHDGGVLLLAFAICVGIYSHNFGVISLPVLLLLGCSSTLRNGGTS